MTVKELIKHLESYDQDAIIAYDLWSIDDVIQEGQRCVRYPAVTQEQAEEVLFRMGNNKDCSVGLNWDVLIHYLDQVMEEGTRELPLIEIDIRWDDGEEVEGLLVSQYDRILKYDDAIFFYGLKWAEVQDYVKNKKGPCGSEFIILAARLNP